VDTILGDKISPHLLVGPCDPISAKKSCRSRAIRRPEESMRSQARLCDHANHAPTFDPQPIPRSPLHLNHRALSLAPPAVSLTATLPPPHGQRSGCSKGREPADWGAFAAPIRACPWSAHEGANDGYVGTAQDAVKIRWL